MPTLRQEFKGGDSLEARESVSQRDNSWSPTEMVARAKSQTVQ
jgi:hypothetical protein